ncbi:hypothetical protein D3C87_1832270 [compost metagenome]
MIHDEVHLMNHHGETAVVLIEKWMIESQDKNEKWSVDLFSLQEKINLLKESIQKIRTAIPASL